MRPEHSLGAILRTHWREVFGSKHFAPHQKRTLAALRDCRTAALGGHATACSGCGVVRVQYNSCRNRHCPQCQTVERERWIARREADLLPVRYFHVVFTLPHQLNVLAEQFPRQVYDALFRAAWSTLRSFGADHKHLGAQTGAVMVLHTWGQNLSLHPHVHAIVPGGGMTKAGKWKHARANGKFLFPVKAMSRVFRARYVARLRQSGIPLDEDLINDCFRKPWVVYAKRPFGGPKQVVEYLGRYSHKVAISNHRLGEVSQQSATFDYKDYRKGGVKKRMTLSSLEFIRRFARHILPPRYVRIRHYGILSSRAKAGALAAIRTALGVAPISPPDTDTLAVCRERLGFDPTRCNECGATVLIIEILPPSRAPPVEVSVLQ